MPPDILTLPAVQLSRFLLRHRRGETLERYQPQLDEFLREILSKANEFVPSELGAILLDDPRAKMFDQPANLLTVIAAFGAGAERLLGRQLSATTGLAGHVYCSGQADRGPGDETGVRRLFDFQGEFEIRVRSLLAVPVRLEAAICGVLLLFNRVAGQVYSEQDRSLIHIFAGYISSSIQNAIDGIRARELAQRDDLTGLHNDRYMHRRLRTEIAAAETRGTDLSLVFIDLDHFKEINDRHGHLEGSRTLHVVGCLIDGELPEGAVAARYGGDEFVVMLPGVGPQESQALAERLRRRLASQPLVIESSGGGATIHVSASLGVASLRLHTTAGDEPSRRANDLIRRADGAMYQAKARGRNKVVLASTEEE